WPGASGTRRPRKSAPAGGRTRAVGSGTVQAGNCRRPSATILPRRVRGRGRSQVDRGQQEQDERSDHDFPHATSGLCPPASAVCPAASALLPLPSALLILSLRALGAPLR